MPAKRQKKNTAQEAEDDAASLGKRSYDDFQYWDDRYTRQLQGQGTDDAALADEDEDDVTNEWYFSFTDLAPLFHHHVPATKRIKVAGRVLDIGCGMSNLLSDMRDSGFLGDMVGIDYSPAVVKHLKEDSNTFFEVKEMDARTMSFDAESFDMIMDKATTDGMLCSEENAPSTQEMYFNIGRVLRPGGIYVITTVNDPYHPWFIDYVIPQLLRGGGGYKWECCVHSIETGKDDDDAPFVYVFIKCGKRGLRSSSRRLAGFGAQTSSSSSSCSSRRNVGRQSKRQQEQEHEQEHEQEQEQWRDIAAQAQLDGSFVLTRKYH